MLPFTASYAAIFAAIALSLMLGARRGSSADGFWTASLPRPARRAAVLAGVFALLVFSLQVLRWRAFRVYTDTAIEMQVIHNLAYGNGPVSSIHPSMGCGENVFGYHLSLIYLPVAALYRLCPHPFTIYAIWAVALAIPAWRLGRWGEARYGATRAALVPPLLYLLLPTLQHAALFEIHPTPFAAPLLLACVLAIERADAPRLLLWGIAAALAREDMTIMTGSIALYGALFPGPRRACAGLLAFCVAWYFVATHGIMPAIEPNALAFRYHDYEHLGTGALGIIASPFLRPGKFLGALAEPAKVANFLLFFLPLGMRPWRDGRRWFLFAPVFALLFLSDSIELYCAYSYYLVPLLPVLVLCALPERTDGRILGALLGGTLCATALAGALPCSIQFWWSGLRLGNFAEPYWHRTAYERLPSADAAERMLLKIEDPAPALPNYFLPRFYGASPTLLPDAEGADEVVLDRSHPNRSPWQDQAIRTWEAQRETLERGGFRTTTEDGAVVLLRR